MEDEGKECIQDIVLRPHGKDIHLIIDECTDVLGRYVLAVLVGVLDMHNESKPVLFEVVEIERTTSVAIRVVKLGNISVTVLFITLPKSNPPIVTRWNLWLECVFYCCQHFEMLSNSFGNNLDKTEARAFKILQDLVYNPLLQSELAYLSSQFSKKSRAYLTNFKVVCFYLKR